MTRNLGKQRATSNGNGHFPRKIIDSNRRDKNQPAAKPLKAKIIIYAGRGLPMLEVSHKAFQANFLNANNFSREDVAGLTYVGGKSVRAALNLQTFFREATASTKEKFGLFMKRYTCSPEGRNFFQRYVGPHLPLNKEEKKKPVAKTSLLERLRAARISA